MESIYRPHIPYKTELVYYAQFIGIGYYAITCDYVTENPYHKFAHEYHKISYTN